MTTSLKFAGFFIVLEELHDGLYFIIKSESGVINTQFRWTPGVDLGDYLSVSFHKLISILLNGIEFTDQVYDIALLKTLIDKHYVILPPEAKLDDVLRYIRSRTKFDGQTISDISVGNDVVYGGYFVNEEEWWFYFESAIQLGFLQKIWRGEVLHEEYDNTKIYEYGLTVQGLDRLIKANEGADSKFCFVAMAFDKDLDYIYSEAIEPAIHHTGYIPLRVDKLHIQSDKTINDEIIASIKKSHFIIADFTKHKDGVYFEAGYALGRGQKVIYSCQEDDITKAHFDIRNYQHVVWSDPADFKKKLMNKIEAFIK